MPVSHQIILGLLTAGFVLYPLVLFYGWVLTRGWEYGPDGVMPQIARANEVGGDAPAERQEWREAA